MTSLNANNYINQYARVRVWTELVSGEFYVKAALTKNNSFDSPDAYLEYNMEDFDVQYGESGSVAAMNVASRSGFIMGQSLDDGDSRPHLFEYREGDIDASTIVSTADIGGMVETPFSVEFVGPMESPSIRSSVSGMVLLTDISLDTGDTATFYSDGTVEGLADVSNVLRGSFLQDLVPTQGETFTLEGFGMVDGVSKAVVTWRDAR